MPQLTDTQSDFLKLHLGHRPVIVDASGQAEPVPLPVNEEENKRLDALPPAVLAKTDLTQCDTKTLFTKENMLALKDAEFKGEGDPKLKDLMKQIEGGLSGGKVEQVMTDLSSIVGIPPTAAQLTVDYGRFLVVRKQQAAVAKEKEKDIASDLAGFHEDFMASRGQLMFGKVLADSFGIHEVFGALLSPTGGLVGPGNIALNLSPDNPVALHGTVHDAAGYLKTYHDDGPGYNYLDSNLELFGTDSCLSGQGSGIAFWVSKTGGEYVDNRVDEAKMALEKGLKSVRDAVASTIDDMLSVFSSAAVETAPGEELDVANAINDAANKAETSATETTDTSDAVRDRSMKEAAKDKLDAASNFIWD